MTTKAWLLIPAALACFTLTEVRATAGCTVSISSVLFGNYSVFGSAPLDSTGTVVFTCDKPDKKIRIVLSTGSSGTYALRTMKSGQSSLGYNLFLGDFSTVWGDGTAGTKYYSNNNPPNNRAVTVTIYGRIPAQQDVSPGSYTDTLQVQIDF